MIRKFSASSSRELKRREIFLICSHTNFELEEAHLKYTFVNIQACDTKKRTMSFVSQEQGLEQ